MESYSCFEEITHKTILGHREKQWLLLEPITNHFAAPYKGLKILFLGSR